MRGWFSANSVRTRPPEKFTAWRNNTGAGQRETASSAPTVSVGSTGRPTNLGRGAIVWGLVVSAERVFSGARVGVALLVGP